jgi:RNA polymerase sigma-70 factor, ECF subfamily
MAQGDPDAELMLQVRREGPHASAALETLIDRWKDKVAAFIFRSIPEAAEAEDLALVVFTQLWRSADRYQPSAKFSTFLFTIARNLCLNELRRRARHPAESLDDGGNPDRTDGGAPAAVAPDDTARQPDQVLLREELAERLTEALADLPEKQRTAVVLCRDTELSYEEIAEIIEATVPATKSLIHRARETLKARLKPYLRTGQWK